MIDLIKRKGINPVTKKEIYYPQWIKNQDTDSIKIAKLIAKAGSMSAGMTTGVMLDFPIFLFDDLLDGKQIKVIGLGTFKLKVTGKAKSTPEEVTSRGIELDIVFEPDETAVAELRANAEYRFVKRLKNSTIDSSTLDSSSGDYILDDEPTNTTVDTSTGTIDSSTLDTSTGSNSSGGDDIPAGNG